MYGIDLTVTPDLTGNNLCNFWLKFRLFSDKHLSNSGRSVSYLTCCIRRKCLL